MKDPRITGRQKYVIDAAVEGMLHGRILRSVYPSARITSIDTSMVPEDVVVLTPQDVAGLHHYGCQIADQTVLPQDQVRFVGDPVLAVAAESVAAAEEALLMIDVEYEELPGVFDAVSATAPDAPLVHDRHKISENDAAYFGIRPVDGTNICHRFRLIQGDIEAGFAGADVIVEETFTTAGAAHVSMEPHAALASWDDGRLKMVTGNQTPFNLRGDLATIFGMKPEDIQVICPPMGGSFGAKTFVRIEGIAAALARKADRPVRIILDRAEEFQTLNRHPSTIRVKIGARSDGALLAKEVHCLADTGAYADCGPGVAQKMGFASPGPYRIPHVRVESNSVYTNLPPNGAYRGYGQMQSIWASERTMDLLAGKLGIDPLELRLKNLLREGDAYCTGEVMHDVAFEECLRDAAAAIGYEPGQPGLGVSVLMKGMQTPSFASIRVRAKPGGRYHIDCATVEMGQGSRKALATMAADLLGCAVGDIDIPAPDTDVSPPDTRTTSSRSTHMMGRALEVAVANLKDSDTGEGFGEIRENGGLDPDTGQGIASSHWHQGAAGARVSVDEETGAVTVEHVHAAVYAGRVVVRKQAELQNEGSMIMGYGTAMFESLDILDGAIGNPNLSDYNVPSIADLPKLTHSLIEREGGDVHGLGETALPPVPAAIGNALQSLGLTLRDLPMTPERVLAAVDEATDRTEDAA